VLCCTLRAVELVLRGPLFFASYARGNSGHDR
jgi:hypothetical protein